MSMSFVLFPARLCRRILRLQFLLVLPFLLPPFSAAQPGMSEGNIVGQVRVVRGGSLPSNVMVVLQMRGAQAGVTYTDGEGKFVFEGLVANVYHIVIQEKGFQPLDIRVNFDPSLQHLMYVYPELIPVEDQSKPAQAKGDLKGSNPAMVDPSVLLSRFPKEARKHYEKASQLQAGGKQGAAIEEYRKALAIAPDMYFARNNLGSLYLQDQQFAEAEAEFRAVLEKSRADASAYFNLANVCLLTKRPAEAADFIQQGMTREPQSAFGHFLMGSVMMQQGKPADAEKQLHTALEQDPGMANAHLALVNLYLQQGRKADAVQELQFFLRQAPDSAFAPHARALLKKLQPDPAAQ
jgi:tetratricopeptide (TPR) repeat protein